MSSNNNPAITNDEKLRAAYALNLCTVSVSQIIDYDDLYVLEQEYNAILNNLNLEEMPKDEALLNILKQVLDTITYFRIGEGDRIMLDIEYQNKMKNAIWSAVPNLGLLVAGGDLVTMAVSLASQVGIGYMNYRKNKNEYLFEYEKEQWRMQRSAIEQFNGLRRELFDTAWRLAGAYGFPDEYRLTERQIKQYDDILMDENALRRFDRLEAVGEYFVAYPPFFYQLGCTANEISRDMSLNISEESRACYKTKAKEYFNEYWRVNAHPLLREDQMAASCALEYCDILIEEKADTDTIVDYLEKAVKFSGKACDVMQLSVIAYLRIGKPELAVPLLRYLVNEEYNVSVNAQILSGIYINQGISGKAEAKSEYETLFNRVSNPGYLFPWPENRAAIGEGFVDSQRNLLVEKYRRVMETLKDKYIILFNQILPPPIPSKEYPDAFYTEAQREDRIAQMKAVFEVSEKRSTYLSELCHNSFSFAYIDLFNQLFELFGSINSITNIRAIADAVSSKISDVSDDLNTIQSRIQKQEFSTEDYCRVQGYTSEGFIGFAFDMAMDQIQKYCMDISDMSEFSREESNLMTLCKVNNIPDPDILIVNEQHNSSLLNAPKIYFDYALLGNDAKEKAQKREKYNQMKDIINTRIRDCLTSSNIRLIMAHEEEFSRYFSKTQAIVRTYKSDTIAVLDDLSLFNNFDLLFTTVGVVCVVKEKLKDVKTYENIKYDKDEDSVLIAGRLYKNKHIDMEKLYDAIVELNRIVVGGES